MLSIKPNQNQNRNQTIPLSRATLPCNMHVTKQKPSQTKPRLNCLSESTSLANCCFRSTCKSIPWHVELPFSLLQYFSFCWWLYECGRQIVHLCWVCLSPLAYIKIGKFAESIICGNAANPDHLTNNIVRIYKWIHGKVTCELPNTMPEKWFFLDLTLTTIFLKFFSLC